MARSCLMSMLAGLVALGLSACATPEPAPCTAEWVDWKKDRVFESFASRYRADIRTLRNLDEDLDDPGMIAVLRLAGHARSIGDMAETFIEETVPDLRTSLEPCLASPLRAGELMGELLAGQGVDPEVVAWVQALGVFLETATGPSAEGADL